MQAHYRDLLKHSSIYGLGQILGRFASFLLLPLYTRYLSPADYGCIAILDLTASILSILVGSGMGGAVSRYHVRADGEAERDRIWWSGLAVLCLTASVITLPAWIAREALADSLLGPGFPRGELYFSLVLPTLWMNCVSAVPEAHLRVRKQSGLSVGLAIGRLLINVALNVSFLTVLGMGVAGVLLGNLITAAIILVAKMAFFQRVRGAWCFDSSLMGQLWRYSWPIAMASLLMTVMQQADRYMLRMFCGMDDVGIYSLAAAIGRATFLLIFDPFTRIWGVTLHEVATQPEPERVYASVFRYTVRGGLLVILGVGLFARPLISLMVTEEYAAAATMIPIISLAYLFQQLGAQFNVPIRLSASTVRVVPAVGAAIVINVGANLLLIPWLGPLGAAYAAVVSHIGYAAMCFFLSRSFMKIDYPLVECGAVLLALTCVYLGYRLAEDYVGTPWVHIPMAAFIWSCAIAAVVGPMIARLGRAARLPQRFRMVFLTPRVRPEQQ